MFCPLFQLFYKQIENLRKDLDQECFHNPKENINKIKKKSIKLIKRSYFYEYIEILMYFTRHVTIVSEVHTCFQSEQTVTKSMHSFFVSKHWNFPFESSSLDCNKQISCSETHTFVSCAQI